MRARAVAIALAIAGATVSRGATPLYAPGPAVRLPTYTVTEPRLLPKPESWRYGQVPGFEILSDASDTQTKELIHDFLLFQRAVGAVWPAVKRNFDLPVSLILCSGSKRFTPFMPADLAAAPGSTYSLTLRERELAAIVINLQAANPQAAAGLDDDSGALGASMSDYAAQILRGEYVHFLLSRSDPPPPPWLEAGLGQLLLSMSLQGDLIGIPAAADAGDLAWRRAFAAKAKGAGPDGVPPASLAGDENLRTALSVGAIMPLDQLFRETSDASIAGTAETAWGRECYQFVYYCLFGANLRWRKALVDFAVHSALQPPDEALFRSSFGVGTQEMLLSLWAYTDFSQSHGFSMQPKGGPEPPEPPELALRAATDAESGRIKGDTLRMAGHAEAAHYSLIAPYLRGSRDPQLLAALGLEESEAGKKERARRFLEAAVAAGTSRARAYYELARLRYEADIAAEKSGAPRLEAKDLMSVIKPLWEARGHPPPLPEIYILFAQAWAASPVKPSRGNLGVVDEGVRYFPFDPDLIYADAQVHLQYGYRADANALADVGIGVTRGAAQERFRRLKQTAP